MGKPPDPKVLATHPIIAIGLLIGLAVAVNYRFFLSPDYLPLHDSGDIFQVFTFAYSNFLHTGTLPEWLAQGVYGYQAHLQNLLGLSVLTYPVMALGKLFGAADTLGLFKTVVVLEIVVFCWGFVRLGDALFENRAAALFALASLLITTTYINQLYFSFRIVYLVPLLTCFILGFLRTGEAWRLVMAAGVAFASVFGNLPYFIIIHAIYGVLLIGLLGFIYRRRFRLVLDRAFVILAPPVVLFIGVTVYLVLGAPRELTFVVPGRDPDTFSSVGLGTFLEYGHGGPVKMLELLAATPLNTVDATFYVPAAALVFALYACYRVREPVFLAFVAVFAFFLVLTWGPYSPVAYVLYAIPGISVLRHIGLLLALPKVLLCLIAGFGAARFLAAQGEDEGEDEEAGEAWRRERRVLTFIAGLGAAALLALLGVRVVALGTLEAGTIQWTMVSISSLGFLAVFAVAAWRALPGRIMLAAMAVLAVVQGGAYTVGFNVIASDLYETPAEVRKTMIPARLPAFEETRMAISEHPRYTAWAAFEPGRHVYQTHMVHYAILGIDPCAPDHPLNRVDVYSPGVDALIRRLWGPDTDALDLGSLYRQSPDHLFFRLAGCDGQPKLQLFSRFEEQALAPAAPVPSSVLARAVLVEDAKGTERRLIRPAAEPYPPIASLADQGIAVTGFSANRLQATVRVPDNVPGPGGAWLVYADAFHPGWRAAVNASPAKVWKANLAFKALYLRPGDNAVDFDFTHPMRQAALWFIGLFGSAVLFIGGWAAGRGSRRRR
ncbi:MAG: hypothetical protein CMM60_07395 [Rhodospirillaceae bacterium]|jgi:hypothetical protein|nr:hypothetical protein [Rhodospirillaceae bacterium]|tara:strand:- start:1270 stop:3600 length:2331 start_codon:yes stop_codon:yes gene_type:complete